MGTAALGCPPRTARLVLGSGTELGKRHDTQAAALADEDKTILDCRFPIAEPYISAIENLQSKIFNLQCIC